MKYFPSKHLSKKFNNEEFRFYTCYKYEQSIRCDIINYKCNIMDNGPIDDVKCFAIYILISLILQYVTL